MSPAVEKQSQGQIWWERLTIIVSTAIYLIAFSRIVPHGDALRIVRQIHEQQLLWNPNHLIFDPLGYAWFELLGKLGFSLSVLDSFELLSGISAGLSLLLFHAILLRAGVRWWVVRLTAVAGLFASQGFLSMAISQYYFMVQMPFLLGTLYLALRFFQFEQEGKECHYCLYSMGALSAISGALMFNNVLLVGMLGLMVGFPRRRGSSWIYANSARLWGVAAAVGVPVFVLGYVLSGSNDNFFRWLLSYQGESASSLNELYGVVWNWKGAAESLARVGFNLFSANLIENAGLGTVIRAFLFWEPLEFIPEITKMVLAISLTPVISGLLLMLLYWGILHIKRDRVVQFAYVWMGSYIIFNFLWSSGGDLFWFQTLPILWLLLLMHLGATKELNAATDNYGQGRWKLWALFSIVPALLTVNTLSTVVPVSLIDIEARGKEYTSMLRDGDLVINPGWDGFGWLQPDPKKIRVEQLTLMDMALRAVDDELHIQKLPNIVQNHLNHGQRVVVVRLYDKDSGVNPWYGLSRLGWSRARIQQLLNRFCYREVGKVDDVVLREINLCQ